MKKEKTNDEKSDWKVKNRWQEQEGRGDKKRKERGNKLLRVEKKKKEKEQRERKKKKKKQEGDKKKKTHFFFSFLLDSRAAFLRGTQSKEHSPCRLLRQSPSTR